MISANTLIEKWPAGNIKTSGKGRSIVRLKGKVLVSWAFCLMLSPAWAQDVSPFLDYEPRGSTKGPVYLSGSMKLGLHNRNGEYYSGSRSVGEGLSFALGARVLPVLSVEVALNMWFPDNEDDDSKYSSNGGYTFLTRYEFAGISVGTNVLLHFPNSGPYAKFGRHCWSASVYETLDVWDGSGCSNSIGGGILFGKKGRGYFFEANRIRYKQIDSWFLTAGVRF